MQKVNPLINNLVRLPGNTVRLPSRGVFYLNGELDPSVKNGEIHVYPMRAIDEIVIRSPDKLLSGDAVKEVFSYCIPDIHNVEQLFAKDVDYLMIALRLVTYGPEYEFQYTHDCDEADRHSYVVDINSFLNSTTEIDPTTFHDKFKYTVPRTNQTVKFQPLKYIDVVNLMNASVEANTEKKSGSLLVEPDRFERERKLFQMLLATIHSVEGETDRDNIIEWLSLLTAPEVKGIIDHLDSLSNWGPSQSANIICKDCGEAIEVEVPLNPFNFFT